MVVDGNKYYIMNDIKDLEWLEIFLWYKCNVHCKFCYQKDLRLYYKNNISKEKVINLLNDWYNEWKRFVIFSWWEPTLDKNLGYYIEYSKKIGFIHIRVHTNWFWFRDYNHLLNLYNKWLSWITISVHWYKVIHDEIVWVKWSFDIITRALINFEKLKKIDNNFVFDTNTVICKDNIKTLLILFKFLLKFSIGRRMFTLPYSMYWFTKDELMKIFPNIDLLLTNINKILNLSLLYNIRDIVIEAIPYCFFNNIYFSFIEKNYRTSKQVFIPNEESISKKYNNNNKIKHYIDWKIKYTDCNKCIKNSVCLWISKNFIDIYPDVVIKPVLF